MATAPTAIDLSRVAAPAAIEALDYETLLTAATTRFGDQWELARAENPALPAYDVDNLETDPAVILLQAWSYLRLLDRQRVNDAVKAVLAPLATGTDLDNVVAGANILRADGESDAALRRRYLLTFDAPSAGSRDGYLLQAFTAWPLMHDASVIGPAVHGRRGDVDIVIAGPGGRLPTGEELALVRAAVNSTSVRPEAAAVVVLAATRATYVVDLTATIPRGPDPEVVRQEIITRVAAAAAERAVIGGEVPARFITGAAYGPSVIRVTQESPAADIAPEPYTIPICTSIHVRLETQ
ncbi:MAG: hypothetical protein B7Z40_13475 [Bosea sp. 12-68-7]|nr:MAG: hypothetical protein B7Z40_13475 [Bosea sp. 12-68-7]OYX00813.1 MAG: hypothetical protein B7Z14_07960 [Bosea sp. 32-68-6]